MAGTVTALKFQKKNQDRVSVYLDGRFAFGLPGIVAARLKRGQSLTEDEIEALKTEGAVETEYHRALNYLSYRPRSQSEVTRYLRRRGVSDNAIAAIVDRLERAGLVDDEEFARFWLENRERFRPRGLHALRYELREKGIDDKIIDRVLSAFDASASAYRAAAKKAQRLRHLDRMAFRRKLTAHLARRGFAYDVVREVVDRHWNELTGGE
jgi:regulatory protein